MPENMKDSELKKVIGGYNESGSTFYIDLHECIGCGDCANHCPVFAIYPVDGLFSIDPELCVCCYNCLNDCPVHCISIR